MAYEGSIRKDTTFSKMFAVDSKEYAAKGFASERWKNGDGKNCNDTYKIDHLKLEKRSEQSTATSNVIEVARSSLFFS